MDNIAPAKAHACQLKTTKANTTTMRSRKIKSITLTLGVALFFLTDIAYGQKAVLVSEDTKCPVLKNKGTGRYSIEKSDIKQLFVPAFKTETQLKSETTIPVSSAWQKEKEITQSQSRKGGAGPRSPCLFGYSDGNTCCCPTCKYYTTYPKVTDSAGTEWFVVHFPDDDMYQWVEVGECGVNSTSMCKNCTQEYNFQSVLVCYEDPNSAATALSISYAQVAFPAYCKCTCGTQISPITISPPDKPTRKPPSPTIAKATSPPGVIGSPGRIGMPGAHGARP